MSSDPALRFGLTADGGSDPVRDAALAERLGFEYFGRGEHLFFHGPTSNGFVDLAAAAAATTRIELLSLITLLPLYPPPLVAKLATSVDAVSNGRFNLGVGVGGEFPAEFAAVGVPVGERGARADEALELIRRLWTEDVVSFAGRFTTLDGVRLAPKPVRRPHPPVWVAGRGEAAIRRAARWGDAWIPYLVTPAMVRRGAERLRTLAAKAGRDPDALRVGVSVFAACHDDVDVARRFVREQLERDYAQSFAGLVEKYAVAGPADRCVEHLETYRDAGADTVVFTSSCPPEYRDENVHRLADQVAAALR